MKNSHNGPRCCGGLDLTEMHKRYHMGADRTLYPATKIDPTVTKKEVQAVVKFSERCQSIDPAPVMHTKDKIAIAKNWTRLTIDSIVVHLILQYGRKLEAKLQTRLFTS